ncbi:Uncharacterized protein BP5553_00591 [Venustampulla echinocandica]|uniref:rRNA-processing protein EFG1 n=1 Tax=Venustampulla echinocandica TaxID=2656787 RepID=A0A370TYL3_9HELO|nr:Uncharacterized protein BP5553_00591 [Venustampulla echinocandica]RDL40612.1 Uncharacterized protein BP5553_00591 [Venustampulla echinocandica]
MAGKRTHEEFEPQEAVHESRQFQVYGSTPKRKPSKKPRRTEPPAHMNRKQVHASSVNAIKKRLRDASRRLERAEDLPANVRVEDERAVAACHRELAAAETEKMKQKMVKRYQMVRFFERQKAGRAVKRLRKQLLEAQSEDEVKDLKTQMHEAEVDLNYTQYCPLSEPYCGLYPHKKATADEEEAPKVAENPPKPPLWAEVEKRMEEGTLDELRNRVTKQFMSRPLEMRPSRPKPDPTSTPDMSGLNRRERRGQLRAQEGGTKKNKSIGFEKNAIFGASESHQRDDTEGEESEGGFFED